MLLLFLPAAGPLAVPARCRIRLNRVAATSATATAPVAPFAIEDYLIANCHLTPSEAVKASKNLAHLKSASNADAVLAFLADLGLSRRRWPPSSPPTRASSAPASTAPWRPSARSSARSASRRPRSRASRRSPTATSSAAASSPRCGSGSRSLQNRSHHSESPLANMRTLLFNIQGCLYRLLFQASSGLGNLRKNNQEDPLQKKSGG